MIFGLQIILYVQQSSSSDSVCNAVVYFFVSNSTKKKNKTRETDLHPHVTCLSQIEPTAHTGV